MKSAWRPLAALLLAALLTTTGVWHFAAPRGFEHIVPTFLGDAATWVALSGVAELLCAALLAFPRTRVAGGWSAAVLFVVVFPANIAMVVHAVHGNGSQLVAWVRLPLQIPLVLWALWIAQGGQFGPFRWPTSLKRRSDELPSSK